MDKQIDGDRMCIVKTDYREVTFQKYTKYYTYTKYIKLKKYL